MFSITFETARTVAVIVAGVFGVLAIGSAVLLKSMAQKLALLAIFGLLALLVWTQRTALETCVDLLGASFTAGTETETSGDQGVVCTFLGQEVTLRD